MKYYTLALTNLILCKFAARLLVPDAINHICPIRVLRIQAIAAYPTHPLNKKGPYYGPYKYGTTNFY